MTTWTLLMNLALKSTLVLAIAWAAALILRRRAATPAPAGLAADVPVLQTAGGMPMTAGILRPAIFLPAGASTWDPDRVRMVLSHEMAHIVRGDAATQLLARTALALHWWNP